MYKLCKTEQSSKRQKEIEGALLCLMKKVPYAQISITELCESIPIPRKAFYRYFDGKDGALRGLIEHTLADFYTYNAPTGGKRSLERELRNFFLFWQERRDLLDAIERNDLMGLLLDVSVNYPIETMIKLERFLPDDPESRRRAVFRFASVGLLFHMLDWYRSGFLESPDDMARSTIRMLCQPIFPSLARLGFDEEELTRPIGASKT